MGDQVVITLELRALSSRKAGFTSWGRGVRVWRHGESAHRMGERGHASQRTCCVHGRFPKYLCRGVLPLLDFSGMAGAGKTAYIAAIQAGLEKHYAPMERVFGEVIERSRSSS